MPHTNAVPVVLSPRQRQVLEGLSAGNSLPEVAVALSISPNTAESYLRSAKDKLYGVTENAAAVAVGLATKAIARPPRLDPDSLVLPPEQHDLILLIAQGMSTPQIAGGLGRSLVAVRADGRELLKSLRARNRVHAITRAWRYQILTPEVVIAWHR